MRIVFVHTPMPLRDVPGRQMYWRNLDTRYYATHPKSSVMKETLWELPHWITWLGGVLHAAGFQDLDVLDLYTSCSLLNTIDSEKIFSMLEGHPADVFLFSPMTTNLPYALQIADMVKSLYPKSKNIFGGVAASPLRNEVARHPSVDFVVFDRGEYALPALMKALEDSSAIAKVGNLTYRNGKGRITSSGFIYPPMPVNEIPFPRIDLFPPSTGENIRYLRTVHALGCPYSCAYCSIQTNNCQQSYFSIDRVLSEIRAYRAQLGQHHHIYFGDETFTLNPDRTLELCARLQSEGSIIYDCQTRVTSLKDTRLPRALYQSGCRWLELGIESAKQETLDFHNKKSHANLVDDTLKRLRDEGLPVCAYMMVGFPNETTNDMKRTIDWACTLLGQGLLHASYLSCLVPYPGSDMFANPEKYGIKLRHREFDLYHEDLLPVFDSQLSTAEEVYEVFLEGVNLIGQAMSSQPYLGEMINNTDSPQSYGAFWK